ncbi:MAG: hypothetical protein ACYC35_08315 [Pirellulales bacterium]
MGTFAASRRWRTIRRRLHQAIRAVDWPPGSGSFTIHPESGKRRGEGNGVTPIKKGLIARLLSEGWHAEHALDTLPRSRC